jgi:hypothetical protein
MQGAWRTDVRERPKTLPRVDSPVATPVARWPPAEQAYTEDALSRLRYLADLCFGC